MSQILLFSLLVGSAYGAPKSAPQLNLFQVLATSAPTLKFKKRAELETYGATRLGASCSLHMVSKSCEAASNFYNGVLETASGGSIEKGNTYQFVSMSHHGDFMKAVFQNPENSVCKIEISCTNPDLAQWSVEDFEDETNRTFETHSLAPRGIASATNTPDSDSILGPISTHLKDLKGSLMNGLFGSGLPGKSGIQLHIGSDLQAFHDEDGIALFKGKKCNLVSQEGTSIGNNYDKDSKFAFMGFSPKPEKHAVDLVFANWSHSPHQIRIRCFGDQSDIQGLALNEVERDLNGSIHFYQK